MKQIKVYNLSNLPVTFVDNFFELQEDFKIYDAEKNKKLQNLILTRGFKYAFKAWQDDEGKLWIIDAHQRKSALLELEKQGYEIPPIPYELIYAENKRDAVKEIAAYNSEFATKNPDTLLFEQYNITIDELDEFALLMLATPGDPLYESYTHGKVIGDFNKEAKLEELSEKGDVDAITTQRLYRTRKKIDTLKKDLFGI